MRLAVIADTHGNLIALEAVIADIKTHTPDEIVDLGDCVSGPLWPRETADLLMSLKLPTARGNHDRTVVSGSLGKMGASDAYAAPLLDAHHRDWLAALPLTCSPCDGVLACHGNPADDNGFLVDALAPGHGFVLAPRVEIAARLDLVASPVVLCGHTHVPRVVWLESVGNSQLVVNPGSVGLPAFVFGGQAFQCGAPHARYAVLTQRNGHWQADLKTVVYDWAKASKQAAANGRQDWATGLLTGYAC